MKTTSYAFILTLAALILLAVPAGSFCAEEVKEGDTIETVKKILGKPTGSIKSENFQLLYYDKGKVEIRDDKVTLIDLMTDEQLAAKKEADKESARIAAERRAQNTFEGEKVRKEKLANYDFVTSSHQNQVKFWQSFKKRYPYVSIEKEYRVALDGLQKEIKEEQEVIAALEEKARLQNRITELENRVAEAEKRAREPQRVIYTAPTIYYHYPYPGYRTKNLHPTRNPNCNNSYSTYSHGTGYANYGLQSDFYLSNGSISLQGSF